MRVGDLNLCVCLCLVVIVVLVVLVVLVVVVVVVVVVVMVFVVVVVKVMVVGFVDDVSDWISCAFAVSFRMRDAAAQNTNIMSPGPMVCVPVV